jgi:hypothetical protein
LPLSVRLNMSGPNNGQNQQQPRPQTKAERDTFQLQAVALAYHVGQRPAARQLGVSENTVRSWCLRFRRKNPDFSFPQIASKARADSRQPCATAAYAAYERAIKLHSDRSRLGLAQAGTLASEKFASLPATRLVERDTAQALEAVSRAVDRTHGWSIAAQQAPAVNVAVQVNAPTPEERAELTALDRKLDAIAAKLKASTTPQA